MGNITLHTTTRSHLDRRQWAKGARAFVLACSVLSLPLFSCMEKGAPGKKETPAFSDNHSKKAPGESKAARANVSAIFGLSKDVEKNKAEIAREEAKMGSLVKALEPEKLLRLYRDVEGDIRDFDRTMRAERKTSMIKVASSGIRHSKSCSQGLSEEGMLGAAFLMMPLIPHTLQPKSAIAVLDKSGDTSALHECLEDLKQDAKSRHFVERIREWGEGRSPFSDESLLFLFATIK